MRSEEEVKELKQVQERLKECKDEWLEKNQKGQPSLGVGTVTQILDYATNGVTTWNFIIEEQWREEVSRFNKNQGQWSFDGYVYHVRGSLHIEGIGSRSQFGSKVGIGGKDNQNSAYKAAASDCLKKCASLFGVGSAVYSRIQIETEEKWENQNQQNAAIEHNQQQQQPQQITLPNGDIQQGEWIWTNNNWVHQSQYNPNQGGQYPRLTPEQENTQWYHDTMSQYDPKEYQNMRQLSGPSPVEQIQQQTMEQVQKNVQQYQQGSLEQAIAQTDQEVATGQTVEAPFENVPAQNKQEVAQEQNFEATPQAEAQAQNFQAVEYGAPVQEKEIQEHKDPIEDVKAENPWNTEENKEHIQTFHEHKKRLGITNDQQMLPHIRDYFKDEKATMESVTPETLVGLNEYLKNIQA